MIGGAPRYHGSVVKKVLLASPRGYCAGVERAVDTVEQALELYGAPVYVRKQIVHNAHVVRDLEARGAVFVESVAEAPEGAKLVLSAHGVAPSVHEAAAARRLTTIDATCPLVTKVHAQARRYAEDGYTIVLIGHAGHEEVVGTMGEAPESILLVEVARAAGVESHLIDDETEIDETWLDGAETVGVTSGASAPERLVARVCDWFRARGVADIGEFARVTEDVFFRLPVELRRAQTPAA